MKLTKKQEEVLKFLESELAQTGIVPTTREIQKHFGFASQTAAVNHLKALEKKQVIQRRAGLARSVTLKGRNPMGESPGPFRIRMLGAIPAGMAVDSQIDEEEMVEFSPSLAGVSGGKEVFALKVRGDSMEDAHILDGDLVLLEKRPAKTGDIIAALIDGEVTLKRLVVQEGKTILKAENQRYPELIPSHGLEVQGVLVGVIRRQASARTESA